MNTLTADPGLVHLRNINGTADPERNLPTPEFTASMRERFPTEAEFERALDRKQSQRGSARVPVATLDELTTCLRSFLDANIPAGYELSGVSWLSGGASKIQFAFVLEWQPAESETRVTDRLVARLEPAESLNMTSRIREYEVIDALRNTIRVPRVFWVDEEATWFPTSTLIYEFAQGVTKPSAIEGQVTGIGNDLGDRLRGLLSHQFVEQLARVHSYDFDPSILRSFDVPRLGSTEAAVWQINRARRIWEEDRSEELPLLEAGANWLLRNAPPLDRVSIIHGDYRAGNFLFDETDGQITAVLDWERSHLGDRHRDLAWITHPMFGHRSNTGEFLVSGLLPLADFFELYEELSGLSVDPERLHYYTVLNSFQMVASSLGTASRVIRLGKSHQDILLAWLEGSVYPIAEELRRLILEVQK